MIPPLHFTQVGDHLLRERPLMETAALRSTDVIRRGHGLRRLLPCSESAMWGNRRGSRTLVEEQLLSYSDICKFFSSMAPSLDDRLLAGERG